MTFFIFAYNFEMTPCQKENRKHMVEMTSQKAHILQKERR